MRKVYKPLTQDQVDRGIVFSSCLKGAPSLTGLDNNVVHEVKADDPKKDDRIRNLKDDSFFDDSPWKYNEIRR